MDIGEYFGIDLAHRLSDAALDIDNYLNGRNLGFYSVKHVSMILKAYQLKDTDKHPMLRNFYEPLWRAIRKNSNKETVNDSELALEMRLLRRELDNVPNSKRLDELKMFLTDFASEMLKAVPNYRNRHDIYV